MSRYQACLHKNDNNEIPKWCVCVNGIPSLALGIFDSQGGAETKAQEMSKSFASFEDWIKNESGKRREVDTNLSKHIGPVVSG